MSDFDVIVLGSGFTGLRAAVAASAAGASVLVVEAQPEIGGRSQFSWAGLMGAGTRFQAAQGIEDTPEELYEQYMRLHRYQVDAAVARALTYGAGPEVEWLADNGVEIRSVVEDESFEKPRIHRTRGGRQIIEVLLRLARAQGVEFALNHRVDRILMEDGRVVGISAGGEDVRAKAVVLATGGIAGNTDLVREWLPELYALTGDWVLPVGGEELSRYAQGDAIPLASEVGAQVVGRGNTEVTIRPGYVQVSLPELPGHILLVDGNGRRFVNETSGIATMQGAFFAAPPPVHAIFDEDAKVAYRPSGEKAVEGAPKRRLHPDWVEDVVDAEVERGTIIKADSLEDLAARIGVPVSALRTTVDRYNAHIAAGHDAEQLKDTGVMRPLGSGPFYATEIRPASIGFASVGPRVDAQAQVLNGDHEAIPGLFAGGECAGGIAGPAAIGGNPTATCLVFGRIAGESAAAFAASH